MQQEVIDAMKELAEKYKLDYSQLMQYAQEVCKQGKMNDKPTIVALGIDTTTNRCTCIYSRATFAMLRENWDLYEKRFSSTNWNGCDDLKRTLEVEHLTPTANIFEHNERVHGVDHDMGHEYEWTFCFNAVMEVFKDGRE